MNQPYLLYSFCSSLLFEKCINETDVNFTANPITIKPKP